eukprot:TRINITY_DN8674_c0_g1_i3.p1 TRINITY_DN8674_c0_g1~~TRINITY_DN8674_c0_g1_i3.p1  ORF type:complete len:330 (+),score=82.00 TRINITY_DN8674_c0_g1_i3:194-1183(+)
MKLSEIEVASLLVLYVLSSTAATGVGFAFSGAGGHIAQQVALMESLVLGLTPSGQMIRPTHISGVSAGAINAVALNAILKTMDTNDPNGLTFESYKAQVFNMTDSAVYDDTWEGMAKIFTHNIPAGFILDNTPMATFLAKQLELFNCTKLKDLYLPTEITLVNQSSGLDVRLWSTDPVDGELDLLEVLLATSAMPIAFPTRTVTGFPGSVFIDGGTCIDIIPSQALVDNPDVGVLYMLGFNSIMGTAGGNLPPKLNHVLLLKNVLAAFVDQQVDFVMGSIDIAAKSSTKAFTYIPGFAQEFSALDFQQEKLQYDLTAAWAHQTSPTAVN